MSVILEKAFATESQPKAGAFKRGHDGPSGWIFYARYAIITV